MSKDSCVVQVLLSQVRPTRIMRPSLVETDFVDFSRIISQTSLADIEDSAPLLTNMGIVNRKSRN